MRRGERAGRSPRGFTYLGLLALVALIGLALAAAGEVAATAAQRQRERQLLWVGHAYRAAIRRYLGQRHTYPAALEELLGSGPDAPVQVRYLRRLYPDPMTGSVDWVLVRTPNGGITGVASRSTRAPQKTGGFDEADRSFEEASDYGGWRFTYPPAPAASPTKTSPTPRR